MDLYIFNQSDRKLSGVVESYEYFRWTRRYSRCGSFELTAITSPENMTLLKEGNIICKSDDEEAGIIERIELTQYDGEIIKASGRFAGSMLSRRIVWGTETLSGDLSAAVGQLLNRHLISPTDTARKIAGIAYMPTTLGTRMSSTDKQKSQIFLLILMLGILYPFRLTLPSKNFSR